MPWTTCNISIPSAPIPPADTSSAPNTHFSYIDPPKPFQRAASRDQGGQVLDVTATIASAAQATQALARSVADIHDTTSEATITGQDAEALSAILTILQKRLREGGLIADTEESLKGVLSTCLSTTRQLSVLIEPYAKSRSKLTRRSLKSIFNKPEVRELRAKLQSSRSTLTKSLSFIEKDLHGGKPQADISQVDIGQSNPITNSDSSNIELASQNERQPTQKSVSESEEQTSTNPDSAVHLSQLPTELAADESSWARVTEPFSFDMPMAPPESDADFVVSPDSMSGPTITEADMWRVEREPTFDLDENQMKVSRVASEPTPRSPRRSPEVAGFEANPGHEATNLRSKTLPYRPAGAIPHPSTLNQHAAPPTADYDQLYKSNEHVAPPTTGFREPTPSLHQALIDEDTHQIITLLQNPSVDVNELGRHNRTPLHLCALLNDKFTAQTLLRSGRADLTRRDTHNRTPLQCALEVGNDSLATLLLQHGSPIEDLSHFIIDLMSRPRKPSEEKVAHACIAWLTKTQDLALENHFITALAERPGPSAAASIARFLEGTPFRERYEAKARLKGGI